MNSITSDERKYAVRIAWPDSPSDEKTRKRKNYQRRGSRHDSRHFSQSSIRIRQSGRDPEYQARAHPTRPARGVGAAPVRTARERAQLVARGGGALKQRGSVTSRSGRYRVRVEVEPKDGKRRWSMKTFATEAQAENYRTSTLAAVIERRYVHSERMTFNDLADR